MIGRPDFRLSVTGAVRAELSLTLAELVAMPQHTVRLPISCVEGWSAEAEWTGCGCATSPSARAPPRTPS